MVGINEKTFDKIGGRVEDLRTANSAGSVCAEQTVSTSSNLHQIWRETMNKLSSYSHRVSESRDVIAASEFGRWLNFCGLIPLFNANPQGAPFKVDGALLQWAVNDLIERCNDRFRTNSSDPKMSVDEYESLHDKVDKMMSNQDTIAGYLAKLFGSSVRSAEDASAMILISGGLDGRLPASGEADEPALVKSRVA